MVMTIKVLFASIKFLFIFVACLFVLALERSSSFSHELDKVSVDYNILIQESLKQNGALLDLSGKKIGDQGLKFLNSDLNVDLSGPELRLVDVRQYKRMFLSPLREKSF